MYRDEEEYLMSLKKDDHYHSSIYSEISDWVNRIPLQVRILRDMIHLIQEHGPYTTLWPLIISENPGWIAFVVKFSDLVLRFLAI